MYKRLYKHCVFIATAMLLLTGVAAAQDIENIKNQKPFEIHGAASASVGYYLTSSTFGSTRKPYTYSIMAAPVVSIYGVQIPFNFTFTEGSKQVTNPFAQFGINPYWKWIKLYAGWSNMSWSPTTLNGKTFLGIGVEINPSLFRFGAMYGRFNPAMKEDTTKFSVTPQYKRRGFAFRVGVGNQKNYVDVIFLKAKDVISSIPPVSDVLNYPPQENAVIGIISSQSFAKDKVKWGLDGAVSAFTRNLNSALLDIGTGTGTKFLKVVIPPRLSTSYAWTAHTSLIYKTQPLTLGIDYNRIQPEYVSMGVDYLVNDQEKFTLNQGASLKKNKVVLNFVEFYQHDNLNKRKAVKTHRTNVSANITYVPNQKFTIVFTYNNFVMFQTKGLKEVNDTTKLAQLQNLVVITPRYTITGKKVMQSIFASVSWQRLDDLNSFTSKYSNNNTVNINLGHMSMVTKIGFSITPAFNILYSKSPSFELLTLSPSLALTKNFWKGKISTSANIVLAISQANKVWNAKTLNNSIGIGYRIDSHHGLKLTNGIMRTWYNTNTGSHEYKGDITYTFSF